MSGLDTVGGGFGQLGSHAAYKHKKYKFGGVSETIFGRVGMPFSLHGIVLITYIFCILAAGSSA